MAISPVQENEGKAGLHDGGAASKPSEHSVSSGDGGRDVLWLRAAATAVVVLLASSGIDYATQILLGNWLGEEDYGNYGVAVSVALLCAYFSTLGADESLPRFLPVYRSEGKIAYAVGFLRVNFEAIFLVSLFIGVSGTTLSLVVDRTSIDHPITAVWWLVPPLGSTTRSHRVDPVNRITLRNRLEFG